MMVTLQDNYRRQAQLAAQEADTIPRKKRQAPITTGHAAVAGGLRGHSMGDGYPLTVIGKGDGFALFNLLTGEEGPVRPTYDGARFWRELETEACPEACPRRNAHNLCDACTWWTSARVDGQ